MAAEIVSRAQAKTQGLTHYFTGKSCVRGHIETRRVADGRCMACGRENAAEWAEDNAQHITKYRADYLIKNMRKVREYQNAYRRRNPDAVRQWANTGYAKDIERSRAAKRAAYKRNKTSYLAQGAKRRAAKVRATPSWVTGSHLVEIRMTFDLAAELARTTGIPHHVDHIVPLISPVVCGLHVPWNLRAIPADENIRKSNKFA